MDSGEFLRAVRRQLADIRNEYLAAGRGHEFDSMIARVKAEGHWPFED